MSPGRQHGSSEQSDMKSGTLSVALADMDTVQEENDNGSDDSSYSDVVKLRERTHAMLGGSPAGEPLISQSDTPRSCCEEAKAAANLNNRRSSAIIAAFRRPSQALALCAATQRRFLSEIGPHSRASVASTLHEPLYSTTEILGHEALSKAISALYAKLLVVLGLAFPVTEVISDGVPDTYHQGFYLYLYTVSIMFIVFHYANLMRRNTVRVFPPDSADDHEKNEKNGKYTPSEKIKHPKENISRYGSFYLRLGAIAFGIGSMVYSGLEFGEYFEMRDRCRNVLSALTPAFRMTLTLLQMQFIFLTSKEIESGNYKMIQRFGFMHMIATNLCEWLYVLVEETKHEIHHLQHQVAEINLTNNDNDTQYPCRRAKIMGALVQNVSPFLFPCTIEYSLIVAVIFYEMWKELKCTPEDSERKFFAAAHKTKSRSNSVTPEKILHQFAHMLGVGSPYGSRATLHHFSLDCSHAHRGLFAGILIIVLTIISLIMFFVLANNPVSVNDAIFQVNICEIVLYGLTLTAAATAMKQMRVLPYKRKTQAVLCLDTSLLILAQSGMFVYCMFTLIGCHHTVHATGAAGLTGFFAEFLSLVQAVVQSLFIIDAWWRRSNTSRHRREKPGRQLVTFILVANMAMWAINTLEKNRAEFRPAHLAFYGPWAWTIITHVSMPLAIFYRFHSTICLFEIWKNTYKNKPLYLHV